jgi:hypothetical protein
MRRDVATAGTRQRGMCAAIGPGMPRLAALLPFLCLSFTACGGSAPAGPDAGAAVVDSAPAPDSAPPPASCTDHVRDGDETDVDCGGSCGASCALGATCGWHQDCADGGICTADPSDAHDPPATCHARVASCAAGACGDALCASMQTNLDPSSQVDTVVYYCIGRAAIGAVCNRSSDKDVNPCVDGAACAEDAGHPFVSHCVAADTQPGAACSDQTCVAGYYCDHSGFGTGPTCQPDKALGATCLNTEECAKGLDCDEVTSKCETRAPVGGSCSFGQDGADECVPGAHCAFATGLACTTWVDCGSQMDCCGTPTGSECRVFDSHTHCAPPTGTCAN